MENKVGRALRRGVALGLVLAAAWGVSLMADLGAVGDGLAGLGEEPALAVTLMAAQLGELPGGAKGLTGWRRLLLEASPLLEQGGGAVLELGGAAARPPEGRTRTRRTGRRTWTSPTSSRRTAATALWR